MTARSIDQIREDLAVKGQFPHGGSLEAMSDWSLAASEARFRLADDVPGLLDRLEAAEGDFRQAMVVLAAADAANEELRAERDRLRAQVEAVEATVRRQVARDLAAWLDAVFAPPIWHRAVSIADPTFCIMCPHCDGSWEGCQHCDGGFIEDGPVGPHSAEPKNDDRGSS